MKKISVILISILLFLILCSFSKNKAINVSGYIHSVGNVPFNYPVLYADNEYKYKIYYDNDETKERLFSLQGIHIQMNGTIEEDEIYGMVIYPYSWKVLKD